MTARHKWADVAIAFAEGRTIQFSDKGEGNWQDWRRAYFPAFDTAEWRIKPEPKPDVTCELSATTSHLGVRITPHTDSPNLRLVFDGETGAMKSAEVIK